MLPYITRQGGSTPTNQSILSSYTGEGFIKELRRKPLAGAQICDFNFANTISTL